MKRELPIKVTGKTSTTYNPYRTGDPTRWLTLEQLAKHETEASLEMQTEASKVKPQRESIKGAS